MGTIGDVTLKQKWERKADSSTKRGIDFNITLEEWEVLWGLRNSVKCGYSNKVFNLLNINSDYYPSLERIDNTKPYTYQNVIWVGVLVNKLKARHVEEGVPTTQLKQEFISLVNRIKRIINNKSSLDRVREPYDKARRDPSDRQPSLAQQNIMSIKQNKEEQEMTNKNNQAQLLMDKMNGKNKVIKEDSLPKDKALKGRLDAVLELGLANPEIEIAKQYSEVGSLLEGAGAIFELTFNQFKLLMVRRSCAITGRQFEDGDVKTLFLKNKLLPYKKSNVLVTSVKIQKAIDTLLLDINLDHEEIKKLGEVLGCRG